MKSILKFKKLFILLLSGFLFASCLTNVEESEIVDPDLPDPCADITFSANVKPIIDNNCIQCHSAGANFPNLTTYNGVSANKDIVKAEVVSGRMPQGGSLTQAEIKAIECWVDAGALNN